MDARALHFGLGGGGGEYGTKGEGPESGRSLQRTVGRLITRTALSFPEKVSENHVGYESFGGPAVTFSSLDKFV